MYEDEHLKQQAHIDKLIATDVDIHDINKQKEVLEETTLMLPDCKARLTKARKELLVLLDTYVSDGKDEEDLSQAKKVLEIANKILL